MSNAKHVVVFVLNNLLSHPIYQLKIKWDNFPSIIVFTFLICYNILVMKKEDMMQEIKMINITINEHKKKMDPLILDRFNKRKAILKELSTKKENSARNFSGLFSYDVRVSNTV